MTDVPPTASQQAGNENERLVSNGDGHIYILVMGVTGAGKSTFVNALLGPEDEKCQVGHGLKPCTKDVHCKPISSNAQYSDGHRVYVVDTPGLNGETSWDWNALRQVAEWLQHIYHQRGVIGGIIYLHDISEKRIDTTIHRSVELFKHFCGKEALSSVLLATTNWLPEDQVEDGAKETREKEFKIFWTSLIQSNTDVVRFTGTPVSAKNIVQDILSKSHHINLEVQKELVIDNKSFSNTNVGKQLKVSNALNRMRKKLKEMIRRVISF